MLNALYCEEELEAEASSTVHTTTSGTEWFEHAVERTGTLGYYTEGESLFYQDPWWSVPNEHIQLCPNVPPVCNHKRGSYGAYHQVPFWSEGCTCGSGESCGRDPTPTHRFISKRAVQLSGPSRVRLHSWEAWQYESDGQATGLDSVSSKIRKYVESFLIRVVFKWLGGDERYSCFCLNGLEVSKFIFNQSMII